MKLESALKRRCEGIAVDWWHRFGLRPFDPLPAEQLLEALEGEAVPPDELCNVPPEVINHLLTHGDWSAGIVRCNPLLIVYHPAHSPARYQSSLMHEIAHILLDHPMIGFDSCTGLPLRDPHREDEATYLGGCLQIPRLGLQWTTQQNFTVVEIATYFGASEEMVRFRANMTGIPAHRGHQA